MTASGDQWMAEECARLRARVAALEAERGDSPGRNGYWTSQRWLEFALRVANSRIDIIDAEFNLHYVDPYWQETYGPYPGRKCYEYFMGRTDPCPGCGIPRAIATGEVQVTEEVLVREGGREIEVHTIPFQTEDGKVMVAEFNLDITARKRAEQERFEVERQLLHAQKLESLGVLAGGIAHDFNNLLLAILGNLNLALIGLGRETPVRPHLEGAMLAASKAADLTRTMLAYSGKGWFAVRDVGLNELVEENAHLFTMAVGGRIDLRLELDPGVPPIEADAGQLQQVVMNLITNAAEAIGDAPGTVILATGVLDADATLLGRSRIEQRARPGRFVWIEVSDTGSGMSKETQERLFDPFYTTKLSGRGLGMPAVLGIMRAHQGAILVKSRPGQGTVIRVLFPAPPRAPRESAAPACAAAGASPSASPLEGVVLVVDDDESVRELGVATLRHLGLDGLEAGDGEQALAMLCAHPGGIDCVLLDLTMPKMDGAATLAEMRRLNLQVPVVLTSGFGRQEAERRFENSGVAAFLQKPYSIDELERMLRSVLRPRTDPESRP